MGTFEAAIGPHVEILTVEMVFTLLEMKSSTVGVENEILVPEDAQDRSDSRRSILENFTTHLNVSSRSVMVLLFGSLNLVSN